MISCKKAAELISKSMDEPLSQREELALRIHNFICEFCKQFQQQLKLLRNALTDLPKGDDDGSSSVHQEQAKQRLKRKLHEKED